ncbi:3-isopropylmalate dehydratase small subunit [Bordetella pertussis]|nr:3-isopropylmalate dehydratase small subunit [Bordetella pertussis]
MRALVVPGSQRVKRAAEELGLDRVFLDNMQAFIRAHGIILPMNQDHVDTDAIIPQRWLVTVERDGLADGFMGAWRYDEHGQPRPECVLNQPAYQGAAIVLARENYGCGSSREHAVWAHQGYGIRAIVAASYGPIFHENCLKNGLLPVTLPAADVATLMAQALADPGCACEVDLVSQRVIGPDGRAYPFEIDAGRRQLLLEGVDDIDLALARAADIAAFQRRQQQDQPWLA